ncbi:MAG TPA: carbon starvation CstA family protein [Fibrobacteria bacterium]|nr:carbon starvation CstA family protein [Fibrobacteria bacterium]
MKKALFSLAWIAVALLGALAYAAIAFHRGEPLNAVWLLAAAACTYAIGYRFYSKWIAARIMTLDDRRATPAMIYEDGKDFVRTNKWIVFGHHFAAISGPGPLVGPVLAAQFGYLPGTLWLLIGVVLGGAVQDFFILFCSIRRGGKSLGEMVQEEIGRTSGAVALLAILSIMIILIAVLGLVVVKALVGSPWGTFTIAATVPIALFMGIYLRFLRPGRVLEVSAIGIVLLLLSVWGGKWFYASPALAPLLNLSGTTLAWCIIGYGLAASILPVWLLLAPRDYLSTFMKLGTIAALALGILIVLPPLRLPPLTRFIDGTGPVFAGDLFPFCFLTIACGAISGFHTLIASGTTPKLITRESHSRPVGYGSMLLESCVAVMAMIAAATLDPGAYFAINSPALAVGATPELAVKTITGWGFPITAEAMASLAHTIGEPTLFGRAGGAPTLALGMAKIFSSALGGDALMGLWYHFAIMFEALFILTTVDAGTRVGRFLIQAFLGQFWKPLADTRSYLANVAASLLLVSAWGYFLYQGVIDPQGGINSLWPLFGIANQSLAVVALCLVTTVIIKMDRLRYVWVTLLPLAWLSAVTFTAGWQKVFHASPKIGFLSAARKLSGDLAAGLVPADKIALTERILFNLRLDAAVAATFLILVGAILASSVLRWARLALGMDARTLRESPPVWLADEIISLERASGVLGWLWAVCLLLLALLRHLAGEGPLPRSAQIAQAGCGHESGPAEPAAGAGAEPALNGTIPLSGKAWAEREEARFRRPRCC